MLDDIEINIISSYKITETEKEKMRNALKISYENKIKDEELYLKKEKNSEILLFMVGIIFIILYYGWQDLAIISEVLLVFGWLSIWESTYGLLFGGKKTIYIKRLKQIINSKMNFREK